MDLQIRFEPECAKTPDTFVTVDTGRVEDALAIAKSIAAANFPATRQIMIHDAYGVPLGCWEHNDGSWSVCHDA